MAGARCRTFSLRSVVRCGHLAKDHGSTSVLSELRCARATSTLRSEQHSGCADDLLGGPKMARDRPLSKSSVEIRTRLTPQRCRKARYRRRRIDRRKAAPGYWRRVHVDGQGAGFHSVLRSTGKGNATDQRRTDLDFSALIQPIEGGSLIRTAIDSFETMRTRYLLLGVIPTSWLVLFPARRRWCEKADGGRCIR